MSRFAWLLVLSIGLPIAGTARAQATVDSLALALDEYASSVKEARVAYKSYASKKDASTRARACALVEAAAQSGAKLSDQTVELAPRVAPAALEVLAGQRRPHDRDLKKVQAALGACKVTVVEVWPRSQGSENGSIRGGGPGDTGGSSRGPGSGGSGSKHREIDLLLTMSENAGERFFALIDGKGSYVEVRPLLVRTLLTELTKQATPAIIGPVSAETAAADVAKLVDFVSENPDELGAAIERLTVPEAGLLLDSAAHLTDRSKLERAIALYQKHKKARESMSGQQRVAFESFDRYRTTSAWLEDFKDDKAGADSYRELLSGQSLNLKVKRGGRTAIVEIRPGVELGTTADDKLKVGGIEIAPSDVQGVALPSEVVAR